MERSPGLTFLEGSFLERVARQVLQRALYPTRGPRAAAGVAQTSRGEGEEEGQGRARGALHAFAARGTRGSLRARGGA